MCSSRYCHNRLLGVLEIRGCGKFYVGGHSFLSGLYQRISEVGLAIILEHQLFGRQANSQVFAEHSSIAR